MANSGASPVYYPHLQTASFKSMSANPPITCKRASRKLLVSKIRRDCNHSLAPDGIVATREIKTVRNSVEPAVHARIGTFYSRWL